MEAPKDAHSMTIGGISMRYAWVSQRGYYPDCKMFYQPFFPYCLYLQHTYTHTAPNKENQDSYVVIPSFGSLKDQALFAVFDGHGKDGHQCAKYARDHVREALRI